MEKLRGYDICLGSDGKYRYVDNDDETALSWQNRNCGYCHIQNREDGHDACIGELQGVMNACCGHGVTREAYVQFIDHSTLRGKDALCVFKSVQIP